VPGNIILAVFRFLKRFGDPRSWHLITLRLIVRPLEQLEVWETILIVLQLFNFVVGETLLFELARVKFSTRENVVDVKLISGIHKRKQQRPRQPKALFELVYTAAREC